LLEDEDPVLQKVLRDVLVEPATGRLRWNRFDSILQASEQAVAGGIGRSAKEGTSSSSKVELSQATVDRVITFTLSKRGKFLRDAFTLELTEMADSAQLDFTSRLSTASFGILPEPSVKADPEQLERLHLLLRRWPDLLLASITESAIAGKGGGGDPIRRRRDVVLFEFVKAGWTAAGLVLDRNARRKIRSLGNRAADVILGPRTLPTKYKH
jgi:hypothetical protein